MNALMSDKLLLVEYPVIFSSGPLSAEIDNEVLVGKISFTPSDVLGHGTAGTFVFR